jgi:hypothetical protein
MRETARECVARVAQQVARGHSSVAREHMSPGGTERNVCVDKLVASDNGDISVSKALKVTLKREHGAGSWQTESTIEIIVLVRRSKEGVASRREKERKNTKKKKLTEDRNRIAGAATLRAPTSCACVGRRE